MKCSRCLSFMAEDRFLVFEGPFREMWATGWRCVGCGRVHNSVVEENRLASEEKAFEVHFGAEAFIHKAA